MYVLLKNDLLFSSELLIDLVVLYILSRDFFIRLDTLTSLTSHCGLDSISLNSLVSQFYLSSRNVLFIVVVFSTLLTLGYYDKDPN